MRYTVTYIREFTAEIEATCTADAAVIAQSRMKALNGKVLSIFLEGYTAPTEAEKKQEVSYTKAEMRDLALAANVRRLTEPKDTA